MIGALIFFDIERLTDTPNNNAKQLGGYLMQSTDSSVHKNSETDTELNINELTETRVKLLGAIDVLEQIEESKTEPVQPEVVETKKK